MSVTPRCYTLAGTCPLAVTAVVRSIANNNQTKIEFRNSGAGTDTGFFVFVY